MAKIKMFTIVGEPNGVSGLLLTLFPGGNYNFPDIRLILKLKTCT